MKRNILIVEDDTDINYLLKTIIEGAGYEVTQAFSGTEDKLCLAGDGAVDYAVVRLFQTERKRV